MAGLITRVVAAAAAAGLVMLAAGCAGNATATGTKTSPASGSSQALSSPFIITARYSAASLGLGHPRYLASARTATCMSPISASGWS
jgi:hypothetical protein